jgi:hypothetical protein
MTNPTTTRGVDTDRRPAGRTPPLSQGAILGIGLVAVAVSVAALVVCMSRTTYDVWGGFIVAPVLIAISAPVLARQARREGDPRMLWFLLGVLVLHLALAWVGRYVVFSLYHGGDAIYYLKLGANLGEQFRHGSFDLDLKGGVFGLNWSGVVAGVSYAVAGPTNLGAFMFFSWLGFWGALFFYLAFRLAVPEGSARSYRHLLFLFPSLAFWSSFLGKDSWMMFGLGIAVYGVARILAGPVWRGLLPFVIGCAAMSAVRPHIAGMVGLALAVAFLVRPVQHNLRELAPIAKIVGVLVVSALAVVLVLRTEDFLSSKGYDTDAGLTAALDKTSGGGSYGGSAYSPPIVSNPLRLPAATVTVLFRPFPTEAQSLTERLVALEMVFLAFLTVRRWRWVMTAVLSVRRQPFVAFCLAYVAMIIVGFSSFANFGLLDRERVQLWPVFFVLLAIPPRPKDEPEGEEAADATQDRAHHHG